MAPPNGRELYQACSQTGPAQAEAFQSLGRYLYQVAYNLIGGRPQLRDLAEDCSQEALVTIWQSLDTVEDVDRFLSWSARVVINKVYDACRRLGVSVGSDLSPQGAAQQLARRRRVPLMKQDSLEQMSETGGALQDLIADTTDASPEASHARREMMELLTQGIAQHPTLSAQSKIVLIRGFINDWDDAVLAKHLGTSRANVHTIRSRDLNHLREDADFVKLLDDYMKE